MKSLKSVIILTILLLIFCVGALQASSYKSYTYNFWGDAVPGPDVYSVKAEIRGQDIGIDKFNEPQDLYVTADNNIYLADSGNNQIICLDEDWHIFRIIKEFEHDAKVDTFNYPTGIFVSNKGKIYVADQKNRRIVILTQDGSFITEIKGPTSNELNFISDNFSFLPKKVVADRAERIYVISKNIYDGLMEFDEGGHFNGFIGAPRVAPNMTDYFWRKIVTKEQKKRMSKILPTEYSNFDIDEKGFIYTTVSQGSIQRKEAIRRLNPTGKDVLRRNGFFYPIGDIDYLDPEINKKAFLAGKSVFADITVQDYGIYSAVDQRRSRIFTYDSNGNLLYVFAGSGNQEDIFKIPVAIDTIGNKMLVLDSDKQQITILEPTEYNLFIQKAKKYYEMGKYDQSSKMWREVLRHNANFSLAYSGIGRALLRQGKFKEAMVKYKLAEDRDGYSKAFGLYRREYVTKHFGQIITIMITIILLIHITRKYKLISRLRGDKGKYEDVVNIKSDKPVKEYFRSLNYAFHVIIHPFDGFWDLKYEKRGNVLAATTILFLLTFTHILTKQYTGFIFNYNDLKNLNVYMELISVVLPVLLWCGVNWGLTTLMEGKGTFKDIYIAMAYALTPLIVVKLPLIVLSKIMTVRGDAFYQLLLFLATFWTVLLVLFGTQVTHHYDGKKTFFTCLLTIIGMGIVIFIVLLFFNVLAQLFGFISTIFTEIVFRM